MNIFKKEIENIYNTLDSEKFSGFITGDGKIPSDILFVGEAPGKSEIELGKPFIGQAGSTFELYLNKIGIKREDIRITNTCFARPIKKKISKNGKISISNRTPLKSEIEAFRDILDTEISLVNPKIIITLGNIPLKRLTDFKAIGTCHGELFFNEDIKRYIFPMYHPSALTYNRNDVFLNIYEKDWFKLKKVLADC
ncbi:MAG: uracil-DNA glycosylase [Clostridiaceae bacterium]